MVYFLGALFKNLNIWLSKKAVGWNGLFLGRYLRVKRFGCPRYAFDLRTKIYGCPRYAHEFCPKYENMVRKSLIRHDFIYFLFNGRNR